MANIRRLLFGKPPFEVLAGHLVQDDDFLEDANRILKLSEENFVRLADALESADGFLDRERVVLLVTELLGNPEESRALAASIYQIGSILHTAEQSADTSMDELADAIREKTESLAEKDRETLISRLRALTLKPVGLAKQCKARQLVDATGAELEKVQIICDLRPIFDNERDHIEGVIPLTILRIEYTLADGESVTAEMRITEKQLAELETKLNIAKRKLKTIRELAASQSLSIPRTKSTVVEDL